MRGTFLHFLVGFIKWWFTPHLGFDGWFIVVRARVVQVSQAIQGLWWRGPAVRWGSGREPLVRWSHWGEGGGTGNLGIIWKGVIILVRKINMITLITIVMGIKFKKIGTYHHPGPVRQTMNCLQNQYLLLQKQKNKDVRIVQFYNVKPDMKHSFTVLQLQLQHVI